MVKLVDIIQSADNRMGSVIWTHNHSDNAFKGELIWNEMTRQWRIEQIPCSQEAMVHVYHGRKGPEPVNILAYDPDISAVPNTPHARAILSRVTISEAYMVWLEEHARNYHAIYDIYDKWKIVTDLHWIKGR